MKELTQFEFEFLFQEVRHGNDDALGLLLQHYEGPLRSEAARPIPRRLRSKFGDADLYQEVCVEARKDLAQFRGATAGEWYEWLRQILRNRVRSCCRRYGSAGRDVRRERSLTGMRAVFHYAFMQDAEEKTPAQAAGIKQALNSLDERSRQVVLLHACAGWKFKRIGDELGISESAARQIYQRARRDALAYFREHGSVIGVQAECGNGRS